MRTLVIADIHNKISTAQRVMDSVPHDKCILLGDYFDSYGDTPLEAEKTAMWLKESVLHNPKIVPLIGNHCISYIFNTNINFRCSGYTDGKNKAINKILNDEDKSKFNVYHIDQGYVFSHAGLTNEKWKEYSAKFSPQEANETKLQFFDRVMKVIAKEALDDASENKESALFAAGWDRGGFARYGGLNWVDWRNLSPVSGINQMVGHSIGRLPRILVQKVGGGYSKKDITEYYQHQKIVKELDSKYNVKTDDKVLSVSYCLDTMSNHYAVIEDGIVNFYDYQTRINLAELDQYFIPDSPFNTLT